jgi:type II secretory pathway pseudopilin PulG
MVVVVLIGILSVLAIPAMISAQVDRRAYDDAISVAEIFREARTRAMGRGAAEMVAMTQAGTFGGGDRGTFLLYEAQSIAAPPAGILPVGSPMSTCGNPTTWIGPGATSLLIDGINLNGTIEAQESIYAAITGPLAGGGTGAINAAYLCFTPMGRAYYSLAPLNFVSGSPLNGELQIQVQHTYPGSLAAAAAGITRTIIISSSGTTRIISH